MVDDRFAVEPIRTRSSAWAPRHGLARLSGRHSRAGLRQRLPRLAPSGAAWHARGHQRLAHAKDAAAPRRPTRPVRSGGRLGKAPVGRQQAVGVAPVDHHEAADVAEIGRDGLQVVEDLRPHVVAVLENEYLCGHRLEPL